jgi:hypothetical protein
MLGKKIITITSKIDQMLYSKRNLVSIEHIINIIEDNLKLDSLPPTK